MTGISEERLAQKYSEEPNEIDRAVVNQLKLSATETDGFVKGMTDISCDVCEEAVKLIERHDKTIEQLWIQCSGYRAEQEALQAEILRLRQAIKKRNHCVDCGKLNPVDNVCEECWREHGE